MLHGEGCRLGWLIDPERRTIESFRFANGVYANANTGVTVLGWGKQRACYTPGLQSIRRKRCVYLLFGGAEIFRAS